MQSRPLRQAVYINTVLALIVDHLHMTSEELSTYFKSVYTKEDTSSMLEFRPKNMKKPETNLKPTEVTEEVTKRLWRINASESPGPDKMHPMIFKSTAEAWAYPLATL
jgi:hypothetical protein